MALLLPWPPKWWEQACIIISYKILSLWKTFLQHGMPMSRTTPEVLSVKDWRLPSFSLCKQKAWGLGDCIMCPKIVVKTWNHVFYLKGLHLLPDDIFISRYTNADNGAKISKVFLKNSTEVRYSCFERCFIYHVPESLV